jgi:hypothetical protein
MPEELKKEWESELAELLDENKPTKIRDFVRSLLAKQQIPTAMTNSEWIAYGKAKGYHDYWKEMTRIAVEEEFVKMIEGKKDKWFEPNYKYILDDIIADIKSKLNKTNE